MKKIIMVIIVILALLCALILGIGGNYLYNLAVNPSVSKDMVFNSSKNDVTQEETVVMLLKKQKIGWRMRVGIVMYISHQMMD